MRKITTYIITFFLCAAVLALPVGAIQSLVPVGQVVGIHLADGALTVASFDDVLGASAREAGLQVGDRILSVDGVPVTTAEDLRRGLERADGQVTLTVERTGSQSAITLRPPVTGDGPRLGVYLRQGITGIGTVTWYQPETGRFGALGHGVNCADGALAPMVRGAVFPATVLGVKKGLCGDPGQLLGELASQSPSGALGKNTSQGIFGKTDTGWPGQSLPLAAWNEVRTGPAVIRSTVAGQMPRDYSVEILKIYPNKGDCHRNLLLKVTDPQLLDTTGGIVQGMSGSPIIQNGKLVGAVTHVLVNDPTTGYGIFIENMLDAAA